MEKVDEGLTWKSLRLKIQWGKSFDLSGVKQQQREARFRHEYEARCLRRRESSLGDTKG